MTLASKRVRLEASQQEVEGQMEDEEVTREIIDYPFKKLGCEE